MSQPPVYNRSTSFTNYQAANPSAPLLGNAVDIEFNNVKTTLDAVLSNLTRIQNDDTTLKNASVGANQLASSLVLGFSSPTTWVSGHAYTASPASAVFHGSAIYTCLVSHTSGTFSTDLSAAKWLLVLDLSAIPITAASQVSVTASGLLTTDAQGSLQALDAGKAATSHTHLSSAISDSTAAGRAMLTAADATAQVALLSLANPFTTGDVKLTIKTVADPGWIMMNDGTIGSGTSGATFADPTAQTLFTLIWNNIVDTWAPVSTGRGVSAAADWAANKTIALTKTLGRALGLSGAGSGLTSRVLGQTLGEETHLLVSGEIPAHTHGATSTDAGHTHNYSRAGTGASYSTPGGGGAFDTLSTVATASGTASITTTIASTGGGGAHNVMQPTSFLNAMIKL
jgi:microcystin-dependent protein